MHQLAGTAERIGSLNYRTDSVRQAAPGLLWGRPVGRRRRLSWTSHSETESRDCFVVQVDLFLEHECVRADSPFRHGPRVMHPRLRVGGCWPSRFEA